MQYQELAGRDTYTFEYGDVNIPEDFDIIHKLSPMHNIEDLGKKPMPPILVRAGLRMFNFHHEVPLTADS